MLFPACSHNGAGASPRNFVAYFLITGAYFLVKSGEDQSEGACSPNAVLSGAEARVGTRAETELHELGT